jgi:S-disulfanyl-L-cysteine oxidoreductase SoxD
VQPRPPTDPPDPPDSRADPRNPGPRNPGPRPPAGSAGSAAALAARIAASAAIALLAACTVEPPEAQRVAVGKVVYDTYCAACHGAALEGQPDWRQRRADGRLPAPPHDASGHTWHHADRELFEITKYGLQRFAGPDYQSDMPAYDGILTDEQIRSVIVYIKSTWPERIRERQAQIDRSRQ